LRFTRDIDSGSPATAIALWKFDFWRNLILLRLVSRTRRGIT